MISSRRDPDDPWSRFFNALKERQAKHTRDVMEGDLGERDYVAAVARFKEIDAVVEIARSIRRNEDINGPRETTESVAGQYDA